MVGKVFKKILLGTIVLSSLVCFAPKAGMDIMPFDAVINAKAGNDVFTISDDRTTLIADGPFTQSDLMKACSSSVVTKFKATSNCILPINCDFLFANTLFESIDLSEANFSKVKSMNSMFTNCTKLKNVKVKVPSNVVSIVAMFGYCKSLEEIDVTGWDLSIITDINSLFYGCSSLKHIYGLNKLYTNRIEYMSSMFSGCSSLETLDMSKLNFPKLKEAKSLFAGCTKLKDVKLPYMTNPTLEATSNMFKGCESLTKLDLSNMNTSKVENMEAMFNGCMNLRTIKVSELWSTSRVSGDDGNYMFSNCIKLQGGNGTKYDSSHANYGYARIDSYGNPGYFVGDECTAHNFDATVKGSTLTLKCFNCGEERKFELKADSKEYDGNLATVELIKPSNLDGFPDEFYEYEGRNGTTVFDSSTAPYYVGEYTVRVHIGYVAGKCFDDYWIEKDFDITKINLKADMITLSESTYKSDGTEKKPEVTVRHNGILLEEGRQYNVTYKDNVNPGTATVTITATDFPECNYRGSASKTFKILNPDGSDPEKAETNEDAAKVNTENKVKAKGTEFTSSDNKATYVVISEESEDPAVSFKASKDTKAKTIRIPETVTFEEVTYKVTCVSKNAFNKNKTATSIVVGKNVKTLEDKAFAGASKVKTITIGENVENIGNQVFAKTPALKKITFKTKKLTTKTVKAKAYKGTAKTVTFKVPKSSKKKYKNFFYKKALSKKVSIK